MARPLSKEKWKEIRTRYALGEATTRLIIDYGIAPGTLYNHINKESWTRSLDEQVTDLKQNIAKIENDIEKNELNPYIVQSALNEAMQLQKAVNNFVKGAVNLNVMNLRATLDEKDAFKRIIMTNKMRANMVDIAGISTNRPALTNDDPNDTTQDGVILYLPDNGR